jgi:hypothetical protein
MYAYSYSNVLEPNLCEDIIKRFDNDPLKKSADLTYKIGLELSISESKNWEDIDKIIYTKLQASFVEYLNHLGKTIPNFKFFEKLSDKGYMIEKIPKDLGYHLWHSDLGIYTGNPSLLRLIGFKFCLTDIIHEDFRGIHKYSAGSIIFYPACWTYLYQIPKPENDHYAICGFMCTQ